MPMDCPALITKIAFVKLALINLFKSFICIAEIDNFCNILVKVSPD